MTKAVNAKVAYFQNLKAKMNGRIKIEGVGFIYSLVEDVLGNFEHFKKNHLKSENAGYDIIENADGDWMSFLGDRVEVNLASGETFNVWIDKVGYYAEKTSLPYMDFLLDTAMKTGDIDKVKFWVEVIEYKLKDEKNADLWRKIFRLYNAKLIACIDDYAVDVDAAAEVEIENAKNAAAAEIYAIKVKNAEDATKLIQMTMSNGLICQNIERGKVLTHNGKNLLLEIDGETKISNWEYSMYAEEIHRKLDLLPVIKSEVDDYDSINGELNSILVKVNGLDVIYYGYGFGPDFHEYDEKLLHINVDRDKHSLTDSKYDEFKTYKSKKKMNTALARYGLNFEQVEQFFANEQSKMDCENEKIHAFIADALNMGDADSGKKIKLIAQKDFGKCYVTLTARDVASRDFDYRKMCDGEYHIRTCRKWSFALSSVAVYETEQQAQEVLKMLGAAIQRGEERFTFPELEEVTTPVEEKNPLKAKILAAELAAENAHKERENFFKNLYLKMCGDYYIATGFVQYVTDYAKVVYRKDGDKYIEDAAAFAELKSMENKMKELYHKAHELNNIALKADILKAKIAEQKNFRKSVIDWKATFDDMKISEILNLQKDLKKFLKLGQIDLAENIFAMLKTLCKNYRAAA